MNDIIDQQQPGSPFYYLKEKRDRERRENDPLERAFNDWQHARGFTVYPRRDFLLAVAAIQNYYDLKPKYRNAAVYPGDVDALRKAGDKEQA